MRFLKANHLFIKFMTSSLLISLRKIWRATKLKKLFAYSRGYEDRFSRNLFDLIKVSDTVWDVGANHGLFAIQFSNLVGNSGKIICFEPDEQSFSNLVLNTSTFAQIQCNQIALGSQSETRKFMFGTDILRAESKILAKDSKTYDSMVSIRSGDELVASGQVPAPNVIKIDVEGFELEVVKGLRHLLVSHELRLIGMEIHFGQLAKQNSPSAPREILDILLASGFAIKFLDPSHVIAKKNDQIY